MRRIAGLIQVVALCAVVAVPGSSATAAPRLPAVTLGAIFGPKPSLAGLPRNRLITLVATGDVIPGRTSNYLMVQSGDFIAPFAPTAPLLRRADITLVDLESPLLAGCQPTVYGMSFCGDPRFVAGLSYAGVDVANVANNHADNFGWTGVAETERYLSAAGIAYCGLGAVAHLTVKGVRFAFLGYNGVGVRFDRAAIAHDIAAEHRQGNVVIVSFHWGKEYVRVPATAPGIADDDPRSIGRLAINSGADLVIGNHPHWVQGVEIYHGKLITYAHGNFIFDQNWSVETQQSVVGRYVFYGRKLVQVRYFPARIYNQEQPRWAAPAEGRAILGAMRASSLWMAAHR